MFGRTLFEYCVQKDTFQVLCSEALKEVFRKHTFHYVRKDTYMTIDIMFGRTLT